jgi:hypothetical protein
MKVPTQKGNHNVLQEHLFEIMWRNQNMGEIWGSLMTALREVRYGKFDGSRKLDGSGIAGKLDKLTNTRYPQPRFNSI